MNPPETPNLGQQLWGALNACPPLSDHSLQRDRLWLVARDAVCTRGSACVTPLGSSTQVVVTADHATAELIAAMTWLFAHEQQARTMLPLELVVSLRGIATRGAAGSARAVQSDLLHGMTGVPAGRPTQWWNLDAMGAA
jgi:hypothetical protein